jgi:hypothetical protein
VPENCISNKGDKVGRFHEDGALPHYKNSAMHSATGFFSIEWGVETCSLGLQDH